MRRNTCSLTSLQNHLHTNDLLLLYLSIVFILNTSAYLTKFFRPYQFSSVQSLTRVWLFATPRNSGTPGLPVHHQLPEFTQTHVIKLVMPSSHLILCHPLSSCPRSLPASGSFPMSQLFAWGGQSIGVSALASVLPKNTQDWSPLEWTGWISLQSKGLSSVFSNTTVQKHQFFGAQFSSQSNSHIHTWPLEKPYIKFKKKK